MCISEEEIFSFNIKYFLMEIQCITVSTCTTRKLSQVIQVMPHLLEQFSIHLSVESNRDCIGFALLRSVIGLENSRHQLEIALACKQPSLGASKGRSCELGYTANLRGA